MIGVERWVPVETPDGNTVAIVSGLRSNRCYEFRVRAIFENEEEGPFSEINRDIQTKPSASETILHEAKRIGKCHPAVYELTLEEDATSVNAEAKTRKLIFGTARRCHVSEKTIMLLGATGSGKSTLIDGILNYILGVEWDDDWRFSIQAFTDEENRKKNDQSQSQTEWITCYKIHSNESKINYTLNVIDTPGFGGTRGIESDKFLVDQIRAFFKTPPPQGIRELDAVCFVTQAPSVRLTTFQKYIFDSVLSLFGKDIAKNIFVLVTFADGTTPPVLKALEAANVPFKGMFKFNNSALFVSTEVKPEFPFKEMFWKMGKENFKVFFAELDKTEKRSLQLTAEVLDTRKRLEITIQGLQPQIMECLNIIDAIKQEKRVVEQHKADITANKDFEYEVVENVSIRIQVCSGEYVTNCQMCKRTCHYPCTYTTKWQKRFCKAISIFGNCNVCPKGCSWSNHENDTYQYKYIARKVTKTFNELKKRYDIAQNKTKEHSDYLQKIKEKMKMEVNNVSKMIQRARDCINELEEKALKENPLSQVHYIELLITTEERDAKYGWQKRVELLKEFKKHAEILNQIPCENVIPWTDEALEVLLQ